MKTSVTREIAAVIMKKVRPPLLFSDHSNSNSDNVESSSPSPDYSTIKIGPPVGRGRTMPTKSIVPQRQVDTDIPMASPDQERVTSTTQLEKAKPKIKGWSLYIFIYLLYYHKLLSSGSGTLISSSS